MSQEPLFKLRILAVFVLCCGLTLHALAAPPDLTEVPMPSIDTSETYNLGATGARGWIYSYKGDLTRDSRQILVTEIDSGSPADGVLALDDVILGASGTAAAPVDFTADARKGLATAITAAEEAANGGALQLLVWRGGATTTVTLTLEVMGTYSATAPYTCPKSAKIAEQAAAHLAGSGFGRYSFGALGLMASGDPAYNAMVQSEARSLVPSASERAELMSDDPQGSTWERGHVCLFLAEYYLATGDAQVLPAIEAYAVNIAKGQSHYGTFGHKYADKSVDGSLHGAIGPYGPVNSAGMPAFLALLLAEKCGITHPELAPAIERSSRFFAYYTGKGTIPYGEHVPVLEHDNNGKSGLAALAFRLQGGKPTESRFFSKMSTAAASNREDGHTGPFFSYLWAPLGANCGGEEAAAAYFNEVRWHLELARRWDGSFSYDPKGGGSGNDYNNFPATAAYLLTYATPQRALWITGKNPDPADELNSTEVAEALTAGTYDANSRTTTELMTDLGNWSPVTRDRAARELATRTSVTSALVPDLILMVQGPNLAERVGACQALGLIGDARALDVLVTSLTDQDRYVRFAAGIAMTDMGETARPRLNEILAALAANEEDPLPPVWEDPVHLGNGRLAFTLFYPGGAYGGPGLLSKSITGVDRNFLYPAIRTISKNPDGLSRSSLRSTYGLLTFADVQALAPEIVPSIGNLCEGNTMFGNGVRLTGIDMLARYRVAEGVPLAKIVFAQDGVGRADREVNCLEVFEEYAGGVELVTPDQAVPEFINLNLQDWLSEGATNQINAANAALAAIAADPNPAPLFSFKTLDSLTANPGALTLPSNTTSLSGSVTDIAAGELVYTWTKARGAGSVSFSPNGTTASYNTAATFDTPGIYLIDMTAFDGLTSVSGTLEVIVNDTGGTLPPNDPPSADPQSVSTPKGQSLAITLTGSDPEGYDLYFAVVEGPTWGTLSGTAPNLTYTPTSLFYGADRFTFEVMDSEGQVASATVEIEVTFTPDQLLVHEPFDYPMGQLLDGTAATGLGLTGNWNGITHNGVPLRMTDGSEVADPGDGYSFTQGWDDTNPHIPTSGNFVSPVGNIGNAHLHGWVTLNPSVTSTFTEGSTTWISGISHSTGAWGWWRALGVGNGRITEDRGAAATGEVIAVGAPHNSSPGAIYYENNGSGNFLPNGSGSLPGPEPGLMVLKITWSDTGPDQFSAYQFDLGDGSAAPSEAVFNDNAESNRVDFDQSTFNTLTFGGGRMEMDEIRIGSSFSSIIGNASGANRAPLSANQSLSTPLNTALPITLPAMDPDRDALTYTILTNPANGALTGTAPDLSYQPTIGFNGVDSFTFKVNDGEFDSPTATVSITVSADDPDLLVYEGFDYPQDSNLDTAGGGSGLAGSWTGFGTADNTGGILVQSSAIQAEPTDWNGVLAGNLASFPATGRFAGCGATGTDHLAGFRSLDPAVTATFTDGGVTWMSAIFSRTAATGHSKPALALGTDPLDQRAQDLNGGSAALGFGTNYNASNGPIFAATWNATSKTTGTSVGQKLGGALGTNTQQLVVARIDWGANPAAPDTISLYNFGENDSGGITEAIWDAATKGVHSAVLDQTRFDTISFGGSRYHIDEIRLGKTFDAVIGVTPPPVLSAYELWAQASGLSGADVLFTADPNHDGIVNGLAFFLGAPDANASSLDLLPTASVVNDGGRDYFEFVHRRSDAAAGLASAVEHTGDLSTWTTALHGVDSVTITVTDDGFAPGIDRIVTRIPVTGLDKIFARVTVWETAP